jgi:hypothetical protein
MLAGQAGPEQQALVLLRYNKKNAPIRHSAMVIVAEKA